MQLDRANPPFRGALVYLDTADWSDLEVARDPAATAELRALGASGAASFIVTHEHLREAIGLTSGRRNRIEFMRAFPGTVLACVGGAQLLKLATFEFAMALFEGEIAPQAFRCVPMASETADQILAAMKPMRYLHWIDSFNARVTARSSDAGVKVERAQRDANRKLHRLARQGDLTRLEEYLRGSGKVRAGLSGRAQLLAARSLARLYEWMYARGLLSRASGGEVLFDQLVTGVLPPSIATDTSIMRALYTRWSDPRVLATLAPSLACVKAIASAQTPTRDVQKVRSTEVDKHHAVFAPLVDVFTCDKRNHPIIDRTLRLAGISVSVLRTRSLLEAARIATAHRTA